MNTLAFTLGVLSVIITAFVVVLVWGVVKVVKQGKQIKTMNNDFERTIETRTITTFTSSDCTVFLIVVAIGFSISTRVDPCSSSFKLFFPNSVNYPFEQS